MNPDYHSPPLIAESIEYRVSINYNKSLYEILEASPIEWFNPNITPQCFDIMGIGKEKYKLKLFCFDRPVSSNEASKRMGIVGYLPARIDHIIAFVTQHPQNMHPRYIIALGSVCRVNYSNCVSFLQRRDKKYELCLCREDTIWSVASSFASIKMS